MKRMFGLDGATPLLSVSGRPENCPNLGVGFSACLEVGRNSSGSKLMSMRVVNPFGLVPPAVGIASKPLARAIAGIFYKCSLLLAGIRRFCWLFLAVIFSPLSAICLIKADMELANSELEERVRAVRRFNRFYTRKIGVLKEGLLGSPLSLTEGRVLYELAQRELTTASELAPELGLDSGYLSRMLKSWGREMFATIDARSRDDIAALLRALPASHQAQLVAALERVERLLGVQGEEAELSYLLRPHQPGDIGWIVHRHGVLY